MGWRGPSLAQLSIFVDDLDTLSSFNPTTAQPTAQKSTRHVYNRPHSNEFRNTLHLLTSLWSVPTYDCTPAAPLRQPTAAEALVY